MKGKQKLAVAMTAMSIAAIVGGVGAAGAYADATPTANLTTTVAPFNVPLYAHVGYPIGYQITVTNNGLAAASNVVLTDSVRPSIWSRYPTRFFCVGGPSGVWCGPLLSTVSCSPLPAGNGGTVTCTTGSLSPGASMTIKVGVTVGMYLHNQLICDTAGVTSSTAGSDSGSTACVRVM